MPPNPRNVTPIFNMMRNFLLQRKYVYNHRHAFEQSGRDVPTPSLPEGVTHKLANNYYYTRDGRRESRPVEVVSSSTTPMLTEGETESDSAQAAVECRPGMVIPGSGVDPVTGRPSGPSPFH